MLGPYVARSHSAADGLEARNLLDGVEAPELMGIEIAETERCQPRPADVGVVAEIREELLPGRPRLGVEGSYLAVDLAAHEAAGRRHGTACPAA